MIESSSRVCVITIDWESSFITSASRLEFVTDVVITNAVGAIFLCKKQDGRLHWLSSTRPNVSEERRRKKKRKVIQVWLYINFHRMITKQIYFVENRKQEQTADTSLYLHFEYYIHKSPCIILVVMVTIQMKYVSLNSVEWCSYENSNNLQIQTRYAPRVVLY